MPDPTNPQQLEPNESVCVEHVGDDPFLRSAVSEHLNAADPSDIDQCGFCSEPGAPVWLLAELVAGAANKFFDRANDAGVPFEDGDFVFSTWSTEDVLEDLGIGYDSPLQYAAVDDLGADAWVPDGDGAPDTTALLRTGWKEFSTHVKHRSRFLFETTPTDDRYGPVEQLGTLDFLERLLAAMKSRINVISLDDKVTIYRGRSFPEERTIAAAVADYTSPPLSKASQGRMNPAGISFFYGALDAETAAGEVYDGADLVAVAEFRPKRELRVLDLTSAQIPSPFDPYVSLTEFQYSLFLREFTAEIALPIVRDSRVHQDYVPTQAMTEYIRFRYRRPSTLDGIAFSSARTAGTNVVIFADQSQCLGGRDTEQLLEAAGTIQVYKYGPPPISPTRSMDLTG